MMNKKYNKPVKEEGFDDIVNIEYSFDGTNKNKRIYEQYLY